VTDDRVDPPYIADESTMLNSWLDWHRATLHRKCAGLSAHELRRRAVPPSAMSLLGLVRHMAEVERGWFRRGVAREQLEYRWVTDEDPNAEFDRVDDADVDEAFEAWQDEIRHARAVVDTAPSLDLTFERQNRGEVSLRWVLVHMIEEYARHNGHADLLRESIDGETGE
jgi:uncharacterized damage-inducible protein DinB